MSAPILPIFAEANPTAMIARASAAISAGKLVLLPTETVYGAAGLMTHPASLEALKSLHPVRPTTPFTIHLGEASDAHRYLGQLGELGNRMIAKLWPGPVSLVLDVPAARRAEVAASLGLPECELYTPEGTITLRCPADPIAQAVLAAVEGPVAVTVAWSSPGGTTTHSPAASLAEELDGKVELVLEGGPTRYSQPSTIVKLSGEAYKIVRKGVFDERIIERLLRTTILFVCSGNTCRSPMAEALARSMLAQAQGVPEQELERKGISVMSAGAYAMPGARAAASAIDAVKGLGSDLATHRARQLTPELIHQADMIFTMARGHATAVTSMVPSARRKVATLDPAGDIEDPIGGDVELYRTLAGELQQLIHSRLQEKELLRP